MQGSSCERSWHAKAEATQGAVPGQMVLRSQDPSGVQHSAV
jgi:hypothetical protein